MDKKKVPVSRRALVQRINRKLLANAGGDLASAEQVRKTRGYRARQKIGDYYVLDMRGNFIGAMKIDLENVGRELGVLAAWERLTE